MHAHTHLHAMHTKRMRFLLFRKIPIRTQSSTWGSQWLQDADSSLYRRKPKSWLTSQKNSSSTAPQQRGPISFQWYSWEWGHHQWRLKTPLSLSTPHQAGGARREAEPLSLCAPCRGVDLWKHFYLIHVSFVPWEDAAHQTSLCFACFIPDLGPFGQPLCHQTLVSNFHKPQSSSCLLTFCYLQLHISQINFRETVASLCISKHWHFRYLTKIY